MELSHQLMFPEELNELIMMGVTEVHLMEA